MKIVSKKINDELEIINYYVQKDLTIIVEVYKVPEGYRSIAYNTIFEHDDLEGNGTHTSKESCVELAIKDLRNGMENFRVNV